MKVEDMWRLEKAERIMVRWMVWCVVRRGRVRRFGHVERKNEDDWVAACRDMVVEGEQGRGRGRKTWHECVVEDMRKLKLRKEEAQNRVTWRRGTSGNHLT